MRARLALVTGVMAGSGRTKGKGARRGPAARQKSQVSPSSPAKPTGPQPKYLRPPPRGQPELRPSPLKLDDDAASEDSFTTAPMPIEQVLRKRPAPVDVTGHGSGNGLPGRQLIGYTHGSSSFPPAGESGAVSADGRLVRPPSGGAPNKVKSGSPKSSPTKRRDFQPLDLTTARKIDSMQSEKSSALEKASNSVATRARQQSTGASPSVVE